MRGSRVSQFEDDGFMEVTTHRSIIGRRTSEDTYITKDINKINVKKEDDRHGGSADRVREVRRKDMERYSSKFHDDEVRESNNNNSNNSNNNNNHNYRNISNNYYHDNNEKIYDDDNNSNKSNDNIPNFCERKRLLFTSDMLNIFFSISQCFILIKPNSIKLENLINLLKKQEFYLNDEGVSTSLVDVKNLYDDSGNVISFLLILESIYYNYFITLTLYQ